MSIKGTGEALGLQKEVKITGARLGTALVVEIELAVPVDAINALAIGGAGGGCIDDRLLILKGVSQRVGVEQIAAGELAAPFLQE